VLAVALAPALGCAALRPGRLDVPPGHRAVLGRIDLRSGALESLIEIVREDGAFRHDLRSGLGQHDFVITLPPGRYRIARVRLLQDRQTLDQHPVRELRVTFEVGAEPAVYVGTLRLGEAFGERLLVAVVDEYETTVPALRARYPDLTGTISRSLMRAS